MKDKSLPYIETKYKGYSKLEFIEPNLDLVYEFNELYKKGDVVFGYFDENDFFIKRRASNTPTKIYTSFYLTFTKNNIIHRDNGPSTIFQTTKKILPVAWHFKGDFLYEETYWNR
ncbi:MAG: hypothetical protein AABY22_17645 [Nanoarchaeota archaeon]